jgi:hypothetical protein
METSEPLYCSLTASDLADRREAWLKVGRYLQRSTNISGGMQFVFTNSPGVDRSLEQLVGLEAECCPWMHFSMEKTVSSVRLSVVGEGQDGERAVRGSFAPLANGVNGSPVRPRVEPAS